MLDLMRRHARNWLMKIILGIIIVVFVFYFGSMGGKQRAERIAVIDGKPIVYADFQREYERMMEMTRQRFGRELPDEMLKAMNLKQQALDSLINQAVILTKAEQMNVRVTDEDVRAAILAYPGFQRNGIFDQRLYEQTLRSIKMVPDEFEENQRKMMIALRVEDLIQDAVQVSDREAYDIYRMQSEKINVDFLQISPQTLEAGIKPAAGELEAFLKAHEAQFRIPEQVQLKVLAFLGQDYAAKAKVSDADVADYYERHKERWTKDQKVQPLSEVRTAIAAELAAAGGMYAAADEAKKAHDTIYQNENFDAYAAQNRLAVRATGLFPLGAPPPEFRAIPDFAKIVSGLQKNEISRVLQGERGYYLISLVDKKAPYLPGLKDVEAEVTKGYRETEAKRLAKQEADALLARLKKGESLESLAKGKGLKVVETGLFQPGMPVPKLGAAEELTEALFQISEKKPYPEQPTLVGGSYVIVRFKGRGPLDDAKFAAQKDAIAKYLEQQKRSVAVQSWIEGSKAALIKEGRLKYTRDFKDL
ncbi:MAG: SurA N-terminal domain-containing protein [Deltaproteobacteria bacterium]|nr:SurA N-terminal domain-containing protein [Deltaproteobacteria bacterium]